jgi:outer membrane receptor protein involved in Fe transport
MKNSLVLSPLSLAVFGLVASLSGHVVAQTSAELDTIVVSGSRSDTKLSETPVSIGSVKRAQWDADKAKSVGEIINSIPGVFWNDLGNEQHSMGIRQPISTNAVYQYLEDGIPIRPLGVFNHNALNETNMNGSGGVEVVKGAASSLYGSNAVGGAVNFLTQKPSRTPTGYLGIRHDNTDGFTRVDSGASNTWGDLGLRFSHYSSHRDTNNWQQYSGGKKDSFTLRGDYNLSSTSWLRASVVHTDLFSETGGNVSEANFRNEAKRGESLNTFTWRKDKTTRANLAWEGETTRNGMTTVTLFARNNDHGQLPNYSFSGNNCAKGSFTACLGKINNNHVESVGVDLKHEQNFDWLRARLVTGIYIDRSQNDFVSSNLDVVRDPVTLRYLSYSPSTNQSGVRDYGVGISNDAVFAQLEFSPADKLRLVAGGRYDSIKYDFQNNKTPVGSDNYGAANGQQTFARFSPKLGATYALTQASSLYSNVSAGFTPPEVSQLYGSRIVPNLKPASYENVELGWRALLASQIKLDTAIFRLTGKDTIVSYKEADGTNTNNNAGSTTSKGLEISLRQDLTAWDWRIGGTWAKHTYGKYIVSASENYSGQVMPSAPDHVINAQVGWKVTSDARVALGMVKQGGYWMNDANTVRYDGHTVWNLNASQKLQGGWEVWGQVRNLTDKVYAHSASTTYKGTGTYTPATANSYLPGAPRSLMLGLNKSFGAL